MEYRILCPGDLTHMSAMRSLFGRVFDDPHSYESAPPCAAYLTGLLGNPAFIAVAALHDGRVVGGLAAYVLPKFEQARSEVYIYDLGVDEAFRRQGVATGMIDALRRVAVERGAWVIYVQADPEDASAVALYTKLGTREDVLYFDIAPHRP